MSRVPDLRWRDERGHVVANCSKEKAAEATAELIRTHAQAVQDEAVEALEQRLIKSEERAAALEERGLASEAHIATLTEQQQKSKWPRVPPSLVAMLNKPSGKSDADVQVVNDLAALGGEVGVMREMLLHQAEQIRALNAATASNERGSDMTQVEVSPLQL